MPRASKEQEIRELDDDDDDDAETLAQSKCRQLLLDSVYHATHMEFLRFCDLYLNTQPEIIFEHGRLPTRDIMPQFAYYIAATHSGKFSERIKLISVWAKVRNELRVLKAITGLDFSRSDKSHLLNFINGPLRVHFHLETAKEEKTTATFEDFRIVVGHTLSTEFLNCLVNMREALYILLFINLYIDTGARGADLLMDKYSVNPMGIKWRNCRFYLTPSEAETSKVTLAIEVIFLIQKKTKSSRADKPSLLLEMPQVPLVFDTASLLFITAKLAGVFPEHIDWESLHQRSVSIVEEIPTMASKAEDYVFGNCTEFSSDPQNGYDLNRMRRWVSVIGDQLGFVDKLCPYAFRRMVGNAADVDVDVTETDREQVLGHSVGSKIFQKHYTDQTIRLDVQQITRDQPEDRMFLEGVSGFSARRIHDIKQHQSDVEMLVESQEDVQSYRNAIASIRAKYNSTYGSRKSTMRAEPNLVYEADSLKSRLSQAIKRHRDRFSRSLRQRSFEERLQSKLQNVNSFEASASHSNAGIIGIDIVDSCHISEWVHQIGDRSKSIPAALWFFSRPHKNTRFYPQTTCTSDGKCAICTINMSELKHNQRAGHLLNCKSQKLAGHRVDKVMHITKMANSIAYCYLCYTLVHKSEWLAHNQSHIEEVRDMVAQFGWNQLYINSRTHRPGICPFCLKDGVVAQYADAGLGRHVREHLYRMQAEGLKSVCPCGESDLVMSWDALFDHLLEHHEIPLATSTIEETTNAMINSREEIDLGEDRAESTTEEEISARYPIERASEYFSAAEGLFEVEDYADFPVPVFRLQTSTTTPTDDQLLPKYSDIAFAFGGD